MARKKWTKKQRDAVQKWVMWAGGAVVVVGLVVAGTVTGIFRKSINRLVDVFTGKGKRRKPDVFAGAGARSGSTATMYRGEDVVEKGNTLFEFFAKGEDGEGMAKNIGDFFKGLGKVFNKKGNKPPVNQ